MTSKFAIAFATIAALSATAPAFAGPQSKEGLTLNQIAIESYNSGRSAQDRQPLSIDRNGSPALEAQAIASYNNGKNARNRQEITSTGDMEVASRAVNPGSPADSQLIASAGLTAEEAEGLTLNEIAAFKYNKNRLPGMTARAFPRSNNPGRADFLRRS